MHALQPWYIDNKQAQLLLVTLDAQVTTLMVDAVV